MNKIVVQFGLLVFCISIVFFLQQGLMLEDVLLKSIVVFIIVTMALSIIALTFLKAINNTAKKKSDELDNNEQ